jgi:hypothetical protein
MFPDPKSYITNEEMEKYKAWRDANARWESIAGIAAAISGSVFAAIHGEASPINEEIRAARISFDIAKALTLFFDEGAPSGSRYLTHEELHKLMHDRMAAEQSQNKPPQAQVIDAEVIPPVPVPDFEPESKE